jgi:hypothetical protein
VLPSVAKLPSTPPAPTVPKPVPEVHAATRTLRKSNLALIAGSLSLQGDGEKTWQSARIARVREFPGEIALKADVSSSKLRTGPHTLYLRRGAEAVLICEEARTTVRLERGEAFFDIVPGREPWSVETAQGKVSVLGTRFLVTAEKAATEVTLQRGSVEFSVRGNSVRLDPGQASEAGPDGGPSPAKAVDPASRLAWVQGLEETLKIEAEQMSVQGGFSVAGDPSAGGGKLLAAKDRFPAGQEASAELRFRTKQAVPYQLWVRLQWGHNVPSGAWVKPGDAAPWTGKDLKFSPAWQWVRIGAFEPVEALLAIKLGDAVGGIRFDQLVLTSDAEWLPDVK